MSSFLKKEKQYGLIIPSRKVTAKTVTRPSAFGDSSSDEVRNVWLRFSSHLLAVLQEDDGKKHVNLALKRENEKRQKQVSYLQSNYHMYLVVHHSLTCCIDPRSSCSSIG